MRYLKEFGRWVAVWVVLALVWLPHSVMLHASFRWTDREYGSEIPGTLNWFYPLASLTGVFWFLAALLVYCAIWAFVARGRKHRHLYAAGIGVAAETALSALAAWGLIEIFVNPGMPFPISR